MKNNYYDMLFKILKTVMKPHVRNPPLSKCIGKSNWQYKLDLAMDYV